MSASKRYSLISAIAAQKPYATDPASVLKGLNKILCGKLESDFVAAAYCFIDTLQKSVIYASAGHPPMLIWRSQPQALFDHHARGIILGQVEDTDFQTIELDLLPGDRIILYTDGIIEAAHPHGELFGRDRLNTAISDNLNSPAAIFADKLLAEVSEWSGGKENQDDDLTLIAVDVKA